MKEEMFVIADQYYCQIIAPLMGWEAAAKQNAHWEVGIPEPDMLPAINGLIVNPAYPLPRERLLMMRELVVISAYGVGYDYIDVDAASELGILVTHTPQAVINATAELGLALVLALSRHVVEHDRAIRRLHRPGLKNPVFGHATIAHDASSQTVGIVGYGRIGQRLRTLLEAVGFRVRYTRAHGPLLQHAGYQDFIELMEESDIIVLAVPLTPSTHHLIDSQALGRLKANASLINISRGASIDEEALVKALESKKLAKAALDVFEFEPRISDALVQLPQVILSPHAGTLTEETRMRMTEDAVSNVLQALEGHAQNAINPSFWTRRPGLEHSRNDDCV